jgi:hypothetical protein
VPFRYLAHLATVPVLSSLQVGDLGAKDVTVGIFDTRMIFGGAAGLGAGGLGQVDYECS